MYIGIAGFVAPSRRESQARRTSDTPSGLLGPDAAMDAGTPVLQVNPSLSIDSRAVPGAPYASSTELPFKRPKTESTAVYFQGPSTTNSTNRPALYGSIAGVVVVVLLFTAYEIYALRRKRRKAAADARRVESEGVPFLAVQGNRDSHMEEDGKYTFASVQPTTHLVPLPPPARLNANHAWSRAPAGQFE